MKGIIRLYKVGSLLLSMGLVWQGMNTIYRFDGTWSDSILSFIMAAWNLYNIYAVDDIVATEV